MNKKPCCPASAMKNVRQIFISGILTGIVKIDGVVKISGRIARKEEIKEMIGGR